MDISNVKPRGKVTNRVKQMQKHDHIYQKKKKRQYARNIILWRVRVTTIKVEAEQCVLFFPPALSHKRYDFRDKITEDNEF